VRPARRIEAAAIWERSPLTVPVAETAVPLLCGLGRNHRLAGRKTGAGGGSPPLPCRLAVFMALLAGFHVLFV